MREKNKKSAIKIGNAQAFWGDQPNAPLKLATQQPDLDFLTLDYLAEFSLSIMAIQKQKDPSLGYAKDFVDVIDSLIPLWKKGSSLKVIANAGGLNPHACAEACVKILQKKQCLDIKIGVVTGDDVLEKLLKNPESILYQNLDSKKSLSSLSSTLMTANAYLGSQSIVEALQKGADIVITGRVTDPSLAIAPCIFHYGWSFEDYDRLAGATVAGHLIECGTQATGGISTDWLGIANPENMGYPVVEVFEDGSCILTKPTNTSGKVDEGVVKEQLLYEIGDPACFLGPDVTTSFLSLKLESDELNRVYISGAKGSPPTETYKVSATFQDGFRAEGILGIFGREAPLKALKCGEMILKRLLHAGYQVERSSIECLGAGGIVPGILPVSPSQKECLLRIAIADSRPEVLELFSKEIAPLVTSGPPGVTGYTSGRPHIRPIYTYWPCLIDKNEVSSKVNILQVDS